MVMILAVVATPATAQRTMGPAAAERRLSDVLADCEASLGTARLTPVQEALKALDAAERPPSRAALQLESALHVAAAVIRADDTPPDFPTDLGLRRTLARTITLPTPASWVPVLEARCLETGDPSWAEWIAKAPQPTARRSLERLITSTTAAPALRAVALHWGGLVGDLTTARQTEPLTRAAEPDVRGFAQRAHARLLQRATRAEGAPGVADHHAWVQQHVFRPAQPQLDAARALLVTSGDAARAHTCLVAARDATHGATSTDDVWTFVESQLGLAWWSWLNGDVEQAKHALASAALPRPALEHEDALRIAALRVQLVGLLWRASDGEDVREVLESLLWDHPSLIEVSMLDRAFFDGLGPGAMTTAVRRTARVDAWRTALGVLVDAIEATSERTGYGLLTRREDAEERPASWIVLTLVDLTMRDAGDPEAALAMLEARSSTLKTLSLWSNRMLFARARMIEARVQMYRNEQARAIAAVETALSTARAMTTSVREGTLWTLAQRQLPILPDEWILVSEGAFDSGLEARALLIRSNLEATLADDPESAGRSLREAGAFWDWGSDRWLAHALDAARRHDDATTQRCLECVEAFPDQLYDRACIAAHRGDVDLGVDLLLAHLQERVYTDAGRALEVAYASRDPDLAALRDHPRFPR